MTIPSYDDTPHHRCAPITGETGLPDPGVQEKAKPEAANVSSTPWAGASSTRPSARARHQHNSTLIRGATLR